MFHVSKQDVGESPILTPKIPLNMFKEECGKTHRVCFSPSVEKCMVGIVGYVISWEATLLEAWVKAPNFTYTVYTTDDPVIKPISNESRDQSLIDEHWSLVPISVTRLGYLNYSDFETFKRFEILQQAMSLSRDQLLASYSKLTDQQRDLQDKWYSHDYMRDS